MTMYSTTAQALRVLGFIVLFFVTIGIVRNDITLHQVADSVLVMAIFIAIGYLDDIRSEIQNKDS